MKENYEFRLFPHASREIMGQLPAEGHVAVVVRGDVGDERYIEIERLHRRLQRQGQAGAFAGWQITRKYSAKERHAANLFWVDLPTLNCALEEFGTLYKDSGLCTECGIGDFPMAPILADTSRFKGMDVVRLLSGEILISERLLNVFQEAKCSGFDVLPVTDPARAASGMKATVKYWLLAVRNVAQINRGLTRFGADPFDTHQRGSCQCIAGEIAGYAPLSALKISSGLTDDLALSDVYVGTRRGLLRPYRLLLFSARLLHLVQAAKLRGVYAEPVS